MLAHEPRSRRFAAAQRSFSFCRWAAALNRWIVLVALLAGCGPGEWVEVKPKDGKFVVLMPGIPTMKEAGPDPSSGRPGKVRYVVTTNGMTFDLSYFDCPGILTTHKTPDVLLDQGLDNLLGFYTNVQRRTRKITLQGAPGRSFVIEGTGTTIAGRSYWVEQRLYLLQVITPTSLSLTPPVDRFLSSIRFPPEAAHVGAESSK